MRPTRFVFVEGMIGAGKTTTAVFLTAQLQHRQLPARFLPEGQTIGLAEHPLRMAAALVHPRAPWRDLTIDEYVDQSLAKWVRFADQASQSAGVTICDGLLFHGNLTDLLLMDAQIAVLQSYVDRLLQTVRPLDPVVIYLRPPEVAQVIHGVCDARGSAWAADQMTWKLGSPYGSRRSLSGVEGLVDFYRVYAGLCDDILAESPVSRLVIEQDGAWSAYCREMLKFLGLPPSRWRASRRASSLLEAGPLLTTREVATRLGLSPATIRAWRRRNRLLGFPIDKGLYGFPLWQFADPSADGGSGVLHAFPTILTELGDVPLWEKAVFFLTPHPLLGGKRPVEVLRRGTSAEIKEAVGLVRRGREIGN